MKKRLIKFAVLLPILFYPAFSIAAPYCNAQPDHPMMGSMHMGGMHNGGYMMGQMSNVDPQIMQEFEQKRAELNKLYDQGVKENDKRSQALIKDLDNLSNKMHGEMKQPYRYAQPRYSQQYRGGCR